MLPCRQLLQRSSYSSVDSKMPYCFISCFWKVSGKIKGRVIIKTLREGVTLLTGYLGHPIQSVLAEELTFRWKNGRFIKGSDNNVSKVICGRFLFIRTCRKANIQISNWLTLPIINRKEQTYPILKDVASANATELPFHPILRLVLCRLTLSIPEARDRDLCGQAKIASKCFLIKRVEGSIRRKAGSGKARQQDRWKSISRDISYLIKEIGIAGYEPCSLNSDIASPARRPESRGTLGR